MCWQQVKQNFKFLILVLGGNISLTGIDGVNENKIEFEVKKNNYTLVEMNSSEMG